MPCPLHCKISEDPIHQKRDFAKGPFKTLRGGGMAQLVARSTVSRCVVGPALLLLWLPLKVLSTSSATTVLTLPSKCIQE